jgi:hypothetical protein
MFTEMMMSAGGGGSDINFQRINPKTSTTLHTANISLTSVYNFNVYIVNGQIIGSITNDNYGRASATYDTNTQILTLTISADANISGTYIPLD